MAYLLYIYIGLFLRFTPCGRYGCPMASVSRAAIPSRTFAGKIRWK
jgi:hypothetical protein